MEKHFERVQATYEQLAQSVEEALRNADIVAMGESAHGRHEEALRHILQRVAIDGIFFEHPVSDQGSIDASIEAGIPLGSVERHVQGALQEGKDVRETFQLLIDSAKEKKLPIICVDSSKERDDLYATKSKHGNYYLKGESRDADMAERILDYYDSHPGKYVFIGGAGHIEQAVNTRTGLPSVTAQLQKALGEKYRPYTL